MVNSIKKLMTFYQENSNEACVNSFKEKCVLENFHIMVLKNNFNEILAVRIFSQSDSEKEDAFSKLSSRKQIYYQLHIKEVFFSSDFVIKKELRGIGLGKMFFHATNLIAENVLNIKILMGTANTPTPKNLYAKTSKIISINKNLNDNSGICILHFDNSIKNI